MLKRGDKQFRRSLKTKDRKLADRRLVELRAQVGNLTITEDARLNFAEIAQRWISTTTHALKESTVTRRQTCIKNLTPYLATVSIRNVQKQHCERWATERAKTAAPQTMAHELNVLRNVFDYAVSLGLMLSNPAKDIRRIKLIQTQINVPTREQFRRLIAAIRESDGREDSQMKSRSGADLVELLAYSGCRIHEAVSLTWADVDWEKGALRITGGERGTKNSENRTIPMTDALRNLLNRLNEEGAPSRTDTISPIRDAKRCLHTASRRLEIPYFSHHDFRHFFATTCIEAGVDIPIVSRWLGHKDGGALAMRVYGHLRNEHSISMMKRVVF